MDNRYLIRGKQIDNEKFVVGFYDIIGKDVYLDPIQNGHYISAFKELKSGGIILTGRYEIDPRTVGQCTGLSASKSYRGTKPEDLLIWEGDIFVTKTEVVAVVEWEKEGRFLGFTVERERKIVYINRMPSVKIIGNIYDNPELLEGRKND